MGDGGAGQTMNQERAVADKQLEVAQLQKEQAAPAEKRSQELYDLTKPGLVTAENYYKRLATGDPREIQRAIAPASERISASSEAAKENILRTTPRGGEQRLAMEQADVAKSSEIGTLSTTAYAGAFPALASLASGGIGMSMGEISQALAALGGSSASLGGASTTFGNVANQQEQGKATTMGLVGSLAETAGAMVPTCWVAQELYGMNDARTHVLRFWFTTIIPDSLLSRLYLRFGQRLARLIQKCGFARKIVRWFFDALLDRAWRDVHDAPVILYSVGEEAWNAC